MFAATPRSLHDLIQSLEVEERPFFFHDIWDASLLEESICFLKSMAGVIL